MMPSLRYDPYEFRRGCCSILVIYSMDSDREDTFRTGIVTRVYRGLVFGSGIHCPKAGMAFAYGSEALIAGL